MRLDRLPHFCCCHDCWASLPGLLGVVVAVAVVVVVTSGKCLTFWRHSWDIVVAVMSLLLSLLAAFPTGMATFKIKCLFRLLPFLAASPTGMERFVVAVMSLLLSLLAVFPPAMVDLKEI